MIELITYHDDSLVEMATVLRNMDNNVMIAVNPDSGRDLAYFKFLNSSNYEKATKIVRILFQEPKYIYHNDGKELWTLNSKERKLLMSLLQGKSCFGSEYTVFDDAKYFWIREYFQMNSPDFFSYINGAYDEQLAEYPAYVPSYLKMPDYTKLFQ